MKSSKMVYRCGTERIVCGECVNFMQMSGWPDHGTCKRKQTRRNIVRKYMLCNEALARQLEIDICDVCGSANNVVICNSVLASPISYAYCERCLSEELSPWHDIVGTVFACGGFDHLAQWAKDSIDHSLVFHGKTRAEVEEEVNYAEQLLIEATGCTVHQLGEKY